MTPHDEGQRVDLSCLTKFMVNLFNIALGTKVTED
jgi:hypothetical protein